MKNKRILALFISLFILLAPVILQNQLAEASGIVSNPEKNADENSAEQIELRNSGFAIEWKYKSEDDEAWRELVLVEELRESLNVSGGKDGADGKNGVDGTRGKNGSDAEKIETEVKDGYIRWRISGGTWKNLVEIKNVAGPKGKTGADGEDGKTPEFRVSDGALQWRYFGDEIWLNLASADMTAKIDGSDGATWHNGTAEMIAIEGGFKAVVSGAKAGDSYLNKDSGKIYRCLFALEGGTSVWEENGTVLSGIKGVTGDKGPTGDQGIKGETGEQGVKGQTGDPSTFPGYLYIKGSLYWSHEYGVSLRYGGDQAESYETISVSDWDIFSTGNGFLNINEAGVYLIRIDFTARYETDEFDILINPFAPKIDETIAQMSIFGFKAGNMEYAFSRTVTAKTEDHSRTASGSYTAIVRQEEPWKYDVSLSGKNWARYGNNLLLHATDFSITVVKLAD